MFLCSPLAEVDHGPIYDTILDCGAFHGAEDEAAHVDQVSRLAKPGAHAIVLVS